MEDGRGNFMLQRFFEMESQLEVYNQVVAGYVLCFHGSLYSILQM